MKPKFLKQLLAGFAFVGMIIASSAPASPSAPGPEVPERFSALVLGVGWPVDLNATSSAAVIIPAGLAEPVNASSLTAPPFLFSQIDASAGGTSGLMPVWKELQNHRTACAN